MADEAVAIGPRACARVLPARPTASSTQPGATGAQAIHPGYGFLSENAAFAEAVAAAGLVFIGPPPAAIRGDGRQGGRARAHGGRGRAGGAGLAGRGRTTTTFPRRQVAGEIGYPVMVKAAAGGGGKGMRIVERPAGLAGGRRGGPPRGRRRLRRRPADPRALRRPRPPRRVPGARRQCTATCCTSSSASARCSGGTRRSSKRRRRRCWTTRCASGWAGRGGRGCRARSATATPARSSSSSIPTRREFYFLEMNTRLQVEHPITEMVAGLDLVQWQIRIAAGEPSALPAGRPAPARACHRVPALRRGPGEPLPARHRQGAALRRAEGAGRARRYGRHDGR